MVPRCSTCHLNNFVSMFKAIQRCCSITDTGLMPCLAMAGRLSGAVSRVRSALYDAAFARWQIARARAPPRRLLLLCTSHAT